MGRRAAGRQHFGWLLAGLLACGGPSEPSASPSPGPPSTPPADAGGASGTTSTQTTKTDTLTAPADRWTAATVAGLPLATPPREVRTPTPMATQPQFERALTTLAGIVDQWDADPDNPWAIAHGLSARGPAFELTNGREAIPWLFEQYAEEFTADGQVFVHFPSSRGEIRIEPHTDLVIKVLTEIGVDPTMPVTVQGKPHTVGDLYRGSLIDTYLIASEDHASFSSPDDMPWTLQALSAWADPPLRWTAVDGTPMNLDDLATFTTAVLLSETRFMAQAMQAGADFEKKGQGIFKYTCGGAHLLQGAAYANARGYGSQRSRQVMAAQVPLMFYRLPRELHLYDVAMRQNPKMTTALLVQRLKFAGHFLESMHKLAALGFYLPTVEQQRALEGTAQQVVLTLQALQNERVFDRLPKIRKENEQLYLDIIGDSAHALHGMELALGRSSFRY